MNEMEGFAAALAPASEFSASAAPSPGSLLRHAREVAGVHMATLAGTLKISIEKLEALESDDFSALPNAAFTRALTCSVCRILKIDSKPILELMPKNGQPDWSNTQSSIDTAFKDGSEKSGRHPVWGWVARPVTLVVMALLIGAVFVALFPHQTNVPENAIGSLMQEQVLEVPQGVATALAGGDVNPVPADTVPEKIIDIPPPSAPELLTAPLEAPVAGDIPFVSSTAVPASPNDLLVFRANSGSWVQVKDTTGSVIFQRTLTKGEVVSVSGAPPLTVVVGRADSTEVFVRGTIFDLSGIAKENVARFEVKP